MIQVNLLPDVKREFLRAQQIKHTVTVGAILATLIAGSVALAFMVYVQFAQPKHLKNVQTDIDSSISELKNTQNAIKIVTTQGVLEQIPPLEDKQMVVTRLFEYLSGFTPRDVSYSEVKLDLVSNTITLAGQTTTLERANVLANNLKSAQFTYTQNDTEQTVTPFKSVVFTSLGKSEQSSAGKSVSFQLGFSIDPIMFVENITNQKITTNASSEELLLPSTKPFNEVPGGGV